MFLSRNNSDRNASAGARTLSLLLTGIAGRLTVALVLAGALWFSAIWAVDLTWTQ